MKVSLIEPFPCTTKVQTGLPPSGSMLPRASSTTSASVRVGGGCTRSAIGNLPMNRVKVALLLLSFWSSNIRLSGSTWNLIETSPTGWLGGTFQVASITTSCNPRSEGTAVRLVVPSGAMTLSSVVGPGRIPKFCTGMENISESPGMALKPTLGFRIWTTSPLVRSTDTPSALGV